MQKLERGECRNPRLTLVLLIVIPVSSGEARAACPLAVFTLQGQKACTPTLNGYTRSLVYHDVSRCV
jgi:hypothetical protein